jgi:trehalose synthase
LSLPLDPHPFENLTVREVEVPVRALSKFESLIGAERYGLLRQATALASQLRETTVWNVSSTAAGGGVAEMLEVLVGYTLDAGVDIRWVVMSGDADFFRVTKRIHNRLHGAAGDAGELGPSESAHYVDVTATNAVSMRSRVRAGDVIILHDPQTAGMATQLAEAGAHVVWRCHVGSETTNNWTEQAWSFLRPHLAPCGAYVFSLRKYIPSWIDESKSWVITPSIDPFSAKNQDMEEIDIIHTLRHIGLLPRRGDDSMGTFTRRDGRRGVVQHRASILSADGSSFEPGVPLVVQVSRWDRLKDMAGVMRGFASSVAPNVDAELVLAGPSVSEVTDDPEGAEVFANCVATWEALPVAVRRRIRLVTLPMQDIDENAAMVNALQRHSTVIVQKSLAEGFGLTVAEGMWKSKAVVASNVGGITEQIAPGTGLLLDDPTDLSAFGETLAALLVHPDKIDDFGTRARQHVLDSFVGDKHLMDYVQLVGWILSGSPARSNP